MHHLLLFIPQTGKQNICLSQASSLRHFLALCGLWWQDVKQTGMQGAINTAGLNPALRFHPTLAPPGLGDALGLGPVLPAGMLQVPGAFNGCAQGWHTPGLTTGEEVQEPRSVCTPKGSPQCSAAPQPIPAHPKPALAGFEPHLSVPSSIFPFTLPIFTARMKGL